MGDTTFKILESFFDDWFLKSNIHLFININICYCIWIQINSNYLKNKNNEPYVVHFMWLIYGATASSSFCCSSSTFCSQSSKWTICGSSWAGAWICFACWLAVCRSRSEVSFTSKLEHWVATHCKWVLMSFPAFIFCTVRQPYGSTEMSAAPAGANIL